MLIHPEKKFKKYANITEKVVNPLLSFFSKKNDDGGVYTQKGIQPWNCGHEDTFKKFYTNLERAKKEKHIFVRQREFLEFLTKHYGEKPIMWWHQFADLCRNFPKLPFQLRLEVLSYCYITSFSEFSGKSHFGYFKDDRYRKIYLIFSNPRLINTELFPRKYVRSIELGDYKLIPHLRTAASVPNCLTKLVVGVVPQTPFPQPVDNIQPTISNLEDIGDFLIRNSTIEIFNSEKVMDNKKLFKQLKLLKDVSFSTKGNFLDSFLVGNKNRRIKLNFENAGKCTLNHLTKNTNLKTLDLSGSMFLKDIYCSDIAEIESLHTLDISHTSITCAGFFTIINKHRCLQRITFIKSEGEHFQGVLLDETEFSNRKLEFIDISGHFPCKNEFGYLEKCKKLESLNIHTRGLSKEHLGIIALLPLKYLSLFNFNGDNDPKIPMKHLERLSCKYSQNDLENVNYNTEIPLVLPNFKEYTNLEFLELMDIRGNNGSGKITIKEKSLKSIAETSLRNVEFSNVWVENSTQFDDYIKNSNKLRSWKFFGGRYCDEGMSLVIKKVQK